MDWGGAVDSGTGDRAVSSGQTCRRGVVVCMAQRQRQACSAVLGRLHTSGHEAGLVQQRGVEANRLSDLSSGRLLRQFNFELVR